MKSFIQLVWAYWILLTRVRVALVFTFLMPLAFFLFYGRMTLGHASPENAGLLTRLIALGALSNGLFGLSISLVATREQDILRRYHLAPVTALQIVGSRLLANFLMFLAVLAVEFAATRYWLGFTFGLGQFVGATVVFGLGYLAVAGLGLLIAALVDTVQEAQVYNQISFFGLMFLSGIAIPLSTMPKALQATAPFLPSSLMIVASNAILKARVAASFPWQEALGLAVFAATVIGVGTIMFRWEKDVKTSGRQRLRAAVVLIPMIAVGSWLSASAGFTRRAALTEESTAPATQLSPLPGVPASKPSEQ
jgi:ABC-2 type transport system permease protein